MNKIKEIKIMKKIIIQVNNNLQVLWNSKVKFVSVSQCWDDPSLGLTLVLSQLQVFFVSFVRVKKKREGGEKRKGKKLPGGFKLAK